MITMDNETSTVPDTVRTRVCYLVAALYLLASILTVTTNGLLLLVIFKDPLQCFRRPFAVYIAGLATTDFLFGAVGDTITAKNKIYCAKNEDGETTFYYVVDYFIDNSATVLVVALSVDRLLAVAFPIFYRCTVRNTHAAFVVVCAWVYSLSFSLIQLTNVPEDIYDTVDVHLHVTFALTTTGIIYCIIYRTIRKRRKFFLGAKETATRRTNQRLKSFKSEKESALTAFLILLALVITQIPYLAMIVLRANCKSCLVTTWYFICQECADFLLCVSAIANPVLYGWRVKQFQRSFMVVFCGKKTRNTELGKSRDTTFEKTLELD